MALGFAIIFPFRQYSFTCLESADRNWRVPNFAGSAGRPHRHNNPLGERENSQSPQGLSTPSANISFPPLLLCLPFQGLNLNLHFLRSIMPYTFFFSSKSYNFSFMQSLVCWFKRPWSLYSTPAPYLPYITGVHFKVN